MPGSMRLASVARLAGSVAHRGRDPPCAPTGYWLASLDAAPCECYIHGVVLLTQVSVQRTRRNSFAARHVKVTTKQQVAHATHVVSATVIMMVMMKTAVLPYY